MDVLRDEVVTARKSYHCDGYRVFNNAGIGANDMEADDLIVVAQVEAEKCMILPGQKYRKCVCVDGGEIYTFRSRLDMHTINMAYDIYED